jgi:hypothetical protein
VESIYHQQNSKLSNIFQQRSIYVKVVENQKNPKKKQFFVNAAFENKGKLSQFNLDLTLALTSANIPFLKLENPELRTFLEKYCTNQSIPHEYTLRKRYLLICYHQTMKNIADEVKGKKIWIGVC